MKIKTTETLYARRRSGAMFITVSYKLNTSIHRLQRAPRPGLPDRRADSRARDGARHAALHREQNAGLCYSAACQNIKRFAHKAAQFDSETIAPKDTIFGTETT